MNSDPYSRDTLIQQMEVQSRMLLAYGEAQKDAHASYEAAVEDARASYEAAVVAGGPAAGAAGAAEALSKQVRLESEYFVCKTRVDNMQATLIKMLARLSARERESWWKKNGSLAQIADAYSAKEYSPDELVAIHAAAIAVEKETWWESVVSSAADYTHYLEITYPFDKKENIEHRRQNAMLYAKDRLQVVKSALRILLH
jgi:hypothetical protein